MAVVVAILPFFPRFGLLYGAIAPKAILLVVAVDVLLIAWAVLVYKRAGDGTRLRSPFVVALLALITTQYLAAFFGVNLDKSFWGDLARSSGLFFLTHICLWSLALAELLRRDDWTLLRRAIIASAGLFAALLLIGADGLGYTGSVLWIDFASRGLTLGNETFAAMYLLLTACVGAVEFVRTKSRAWRSGIALTTGLIAICPVIFNTGLLTGRVSLSNVVASPQLLLGLTRASSVVFFGWLSFVGVWWLLTRISHDRIRKVLKVLLVGLLLAGAVVGSALHMTTGSIVQDALSDKTTVARYYVWESATKAIADKPLLGWGPENFDRAFESNFDSRLYTKEGRIEGWFDRAHNVVLDTTTTSGLLGLLAAVLLVAAYCVVIVRAHRRGIIGEGEAVLLLSLPVVHILQLQTAFDVVPTYALLSIIGGYVLSLENTQSSEFLVRHHKAIGVGVGLVALVSLSYVLLIDLPRQGSLAASLSEGRAHVRSELLTTGLSKSSDFEALHRSSNLFVESVYDELKKKGTSEEVVAPAREYLGKYLATYKAYLAKEPDHYRARMHYAYLLILNSEWRGEGADEALALIESSYELSPGNPTTYVLEIMARSYLGDYAGAQHVLQDLNAQLPTIQLSKDTTAWLERQIRIAPQHSFLQISNL